MTLQSHSANQDIIFALSSGNVVSAIHLIRISGTNCHNLLEPFFSKINQKNDSKETSNKNLIEGLLERSEKKHAFVARKSFYLNIYNFQKNFLIDDVTVTFFPGPHSYTGEDTLEICSHGNPLVCKKIFELLRSVGFRDALPGEFTQRAWLNGKISLLQAESIAQILSAETEDALTLAREVPALSGFLANLRQNIVECCAYLEAHIDFGPEDVGQFEGESLLPQLNFVLENLQKLLQSYRVGRIARTGLRVAILGKPNAGKSTLFNALLRENRAIVTNIAGTTRDILEEKFEIQGRHFVLQDTAGLRDTIDVVEKLGIERTSQAENAADIVLWIEDIQNLLLKNQQQEFLQNNFSRITANSKTALVLNKIDLVENSAVQSVVKELALLFPTTTLLSCSEKFFEPLEDYLQKFADTEQEQFKERKHPILFSERQRSLVEKALLAIENAKQLCQTKSFPEMAASELLQALHSLKEIFGTVSLDDIYDNIFSRFCIGK